MSQLLKCNLHFPLKYFSFLLVQYYKQWKYQNHNLALVFQPLFLCISLIGLSALSSWWIRQPIPSSRQPSGSASFLGGSPLLGSALSNAGWFGGLPLVSNSVCCYHSMFASLILSSDFFQGSFALICVKNWQTPNEIAVEYSPFLRLHRETPHLTPAPQSVTHRRIPRAHRIIVFMATVYYSKTLGSKVNKGKKNAQDEIWRKQGLSFLTLGGDTCCAWFSPLWNMPVMGAH